MSKVPLAPAAAARRLRLDVGHRLNGLLQGDHPGRQPGPGLEPAGARLYAPGDDVRRIDWGATARTGQTHLREGVADRELETTLVVDLTASMSFGTVRCEKRDLAVAVAAAVTHLSSGAGDRLGALVLTSDGARRVPPRSGRDAGLALLHLLLTIPRQDGPGPDLAAALAALSARPARRGLVVIVTDLVDTGGRADAPGWARPLRLATQRHDVVVVEVLDPRELTLPPVGALRLVDPESGRQLEVHTTPALRQRYAAAAAARRAGHASVVRRTGAGHLVLRTDRDWLPDLARFLSTRRRLNTAGRPASRGVR